MAENQTPPGLDGAIAEADTAHEQTNRQTQTIAIAGGIVALLVIAGIVLASIWMLGHPAQTETLRDVFIIWIAFLALLIGVGLVVLSVQVARLVNLLQNEIKPMLENTNEAINAVRGTAMFVSENLTEPVVKMSSTVAGIQRFLQLLTPSRPKKRNH
ncbi:MAG: hypothetical protein ACE5FI_00460 [Anaerolineales bacterium]